MNTIRETFDKTERGYAARKPFPTFLRMAKFFTLPCLKLYGEKSPVPLPCPAQVAFSVSKKGFRLAVTRNLIKRRMRESYRKNKMTLYKHLSKDNIQIVFVVILRGKMVPDYLTIEKSMKEMINKFVFLSKDKESIC